MGLSSLFDVWIQNTTTERIDLPSCIRSNPLLISSSLRMWVIIGSIWILPFMYQSTIFGTSVRPRAPPNAVPFQTRPVTSWNGRVEISLPASPTPTTTVAGLQCLAHHRGIAGAVEGVVGAAVGKPDQMRDDVATDLRRVDEMGPAKASYPPTDRAVPPN